MSQLIVSWSKDRYAELANMRSIQVYLVSDDGHSYPKYMSLDEFANLPYAKKFDTEDTVAIHVKGAHKGFNLIPLADVVLELKDGSKSWKKIKDRYGKC